MNPGRRTSTIVGGPPLNDRDQRVRRGSDLHLRRLSSLDGYGAASARWAGYWGKQGPELLARRLAIYQVDQRMVLGAKTFRNFVSMLAASTEESDVRDPWVNHMWHLPATVVSTTLEEPLDWPDGSVVSGDAVEIVCRLKETSDVPLRSHGSLSLNWALMAAGLVDFVQVTLFPVITGQTGMNPIFEGAADFDLELVEQRTLDHHTEELTYRPTRHGLGPGDRRDLRRPIRGR